MFKEIVINRDNSREKNSKQQPLLQVVTTSTFELGCVDARVLVIGVTSPFPYVITVDETKPDSLESSVIFTVCNPLFKFFILSFCLV